MTIQDQYQGHLAKAQNRIRAMSSLVAYVGTMLERIGEEVEIDEVSETKITLRRVVDSSAMIARVEYNDEGWLLIEDKNTKPTAGHQDISAVWSFIKTKLDLGKPPKTKPGADTQPQS